MKGSPAIGTRLLNGLELKHQSRFGLDCLNDHSIAEDLSRLLVERTSRGVEAFNCTRSLPDERQPLWVRHARSTTTPPPSFLVSIRRSHLRLWNSRPRFNSDALRMSRQRAPASQRVPRFRESPKILGLNGAGHV